MSRCSLTTKSRREAVDEVARTCRMERTVHDKIGLLMLHIPCLPSHVVGEARGRVHRRLDGHDNACDGNSRGSGQPLAR